MRKLAIAVALTIGLSACTDPGGATEALQEQGYTDIVITGFEPGACGRDDTSSTGFVATTAAGYRVRGVVCSGAFKGYTIRSLGRTGPSRPTDTLWAA